MENLVISDELYYIVDVDEKSVISEGFTREIWAEDEAQFRYGEDWWTNESPFAVWRGSSVKSNWINYR